MPVDIDAIEREVPNTMVIDVGMDAENEGIRATDHSHATVDAIHKWLDRKGLDYQRRTIQDNHGIIVVLTRPYPKYSSTSPARVAKKWKKLPKGWTEESVKKFWGTVTKGNPKHPVTECISRMKGKMDNPAPFCAGMADEFIPGWRQESARKKRMEKEKGKTACGDGPCTCGGTCGCDKGLATQPDYGDSDAALPRGLAARVAARFQEG
jgi:hypothetical protein